MAAETTLVLVKPDGMRRGLAGEVLARLERRGFELRGARLLKITRPLAQEHYAEHKGKPFYADLVSFITSGPVLALAVRGESAVLWSNRRTLGTSCASSVQRPAIRSRRVAGGSIPTQGGVHLQGGRGASARGASAE